MEKRGRGRPKKIDPFEKGNPDFNIKNAEPVDPSWILEKTPTTEIQFAGMTEEDLALERELQKMAEEELPDQPVHDIESINKPLKIAGDDLELRFLGDFVDPYKPASTINEFMSQILQCSQNDCDSIEATPAVIKHFTKGKYPEDTGYFIYQNVRVFIPGRMAEVIEKESETIEERLFAKRKSK